MSRVTLFSCRYSGHEGVQTQCRGVNAGGSREPALSPGLWLAWGQALRRNRLPHTLKALNGLKGSRKSCPIPMLEGSQEGWGDGGCHATTKAEEHRGQTPRMTQEKAAHIWKPCRGQSDGHPRGVWDVQTCSGFWKVLTQLHSSWWTKFSWMLC